MSVLEVELKELLAIGSYSDCIHLKRLWTVLTPVVAKKTRTKVVANRALLLGREIGIDHLEMNDEIAPSHSFLRHPLPRDSYQVFNWSLSTVHRKLFPVNPGHFS